MIGNPNRKRMNNLIAFVKADWGNKAGVSSGKLILTNGGANQPGLEAGDNHNSGTLRHFTIRELELEKALNLNAPKLQ